MAAPFLDGFGRWLSDICELPVTVVNERALLVPGHVYLAPGDAHLAVDAISAFPDGRPAVRSHRPAANILFSAVARHFGPSAIAVLLTGMGDDGAAGLREIRSAGGLTIAEAESSAVIYGMPAAAVSLGAACESLPLEDIAPRILEEVQRPTVEVR
jgi:two-component system chemotaxis response regulator CheB